MAELAKVRISDRLYIALQELDAALRAESNGDFAAQVLVRGNIVYQNTAEGVVIPRIT